MSSAIPYYCACNTVSECVLLKTELIIATMDTENNYANKLTIYVCRHLAPESGRE